MADATATKETTERRARKRMVGIVTSDKREKTITVSVSRLVKHPKYGKYLRRSTKFTAHDETNQAGAGDKVEIVEARPMSKQKRWRLIQVIEKAQG